MKLSPQNQFITNLLLIVVHACYVFIMTSTATAAVVLALRSLAR